LKSANRLVKIAVGVWKGNFYLPIWIKKAKNIRQFLAITLAVLMRMGIIGTLNLIQKNYVAYYSLLG
jgi:hypothetical protein